MARALLRAGFGVHVWNRTQSKAAALVTDGARQASSPAEAATGVDVLITMLTDGPAVERETGGPEGALSKLASDAIWIQMGTVGVDSADRLADLAARHRVAFVDAPVSGGSASAENRDLIILASGEGSVRTPGGADLRRAG